MLPDAVALYGPPAVGKDTVTGALADLDKRYVHFDRLKIGTGKSDGYRYGSLDDLVKLRNRGLVLYENERYGNIYAVDRPRLDEIVGAGSVPVVHVGQLDGLKALRAGYDARWLAILLWCPRDVTLARLRSRGSVDTAARLQAWDETEADLAGVDLAEFSMVVRTDRRPPPTVADAIRRATSPSPETPPPLRDSLR